MRHRHPPGPPRPWRRRADEPPATLGGARRCAPCIAALASRRSPKEPTIEARRRPAPADLPRPRLLACDIDGTILDDDGILRPAVARALATVRASGVDVVLATGRSPWSGIRELAGMLGLAGPQITMQGALVADPASGQVHRLRALPPAVYRDALRFAGELGLDPIVGLLDGHRAERLADDVLPFVVPAAAGGTFRYVEDLDSLLEARPIRLFLPTGPERHRAVRAAARERFDGSASIVWGDLTGVEILAPGTTKGEAIAWLAVARGLDLDEVAAIGDAPNDTEMLRAAGRSAAMGSAPAEVRAVADVVVPPSAADGLIDALAWFFPDLAPRLRGRRSA
jgi:Cof subfamily protein (haloacid dehalogenase superfamily)